MRIKRGAITGTKGNLKLSRNTSSHNVGNHSELSEIHKKLENVSKFHETQPNHMSDKQVCSISKSNKNNLKDSKVNLIKNNEKSLEKQNNNEDEAIKIFFVDTCADPSVQTQGHHQNDKKLKKHDNNNIDKKFKITNQRYTDEANKPFTKQESLHKSLYDSIPNSNNKFTNKEVKFNNGERFRTYNRLNNMDKEFSKTGGNFLNFLDEQKSSGDSFKIIDGKKAVAFNRPLLKIVGKYKPHGTLHSVNSGFSQISPLEGIINFANMLLYSINKETESQNNIEDKESCIAQAEDFEDSDAVDYLYNVMDQNSAGTMNRAINGNSAAQKYSIKNEPSMNLIENAIESIFSNEYEGENDIESVRCPIHSEYNNNKQNVDGTDDGVVQVCSCRLYKKNKDLHRF